MIASWPKQLLSQDDGLGWELGNVDGFTLFIFDSRACVGRRTSWAQVPQLWQQVFDHILFHLLELMGG